MALSVNGTPAGRAREDRAAPVMDAVGGGGERRGGEGGSGMRRTKPRCAAILVDGCLCAVAMHDVAIHARTHKAPARAMSRIQRREGGAWVGDP